jgi:hypothetical protein
MCNWCGKNPNEFQGLCEGCFDKVMQRQAEAMARVAAEKLDWIANEYAEVFSRIDPQWWFERAGQSAEGE